ncbi:MAG: hypothetical protein IJA67_03450 [Oscillospiraceae bacterium]|nr:hypothetical protein [Oscillospiraceae bacterium]
MSRPTYTVLEKDDRGKRAIYKVLADNAQGFDDFISSTSGILPGSTVDIADYKTVFRLRNDGAWEELESYADGESDAAAQEAAVAEILDGLISDDEIADMVVEEDTTTTGEGETV